MPRKKLAAREVPPAPVSRPSFAKQKKFTNVAQRFKSFRPASEVLTPVKTVSTCFVQFDYASRVGGYPLGRWSLIHGPSHGGKSLFMLGLFRSFLSEGVGLLLDLERTTPSTWAEDIIGKELLNSRLLSDKISTMEQARDRVAQFFKEYIEERDKKNSDVKHAIIGLDSLAKLVPKDQFDQMLKESAETVGFDGMKGRGDMRRAALLKSWLNELIPALDDTGVTMVAIARETDNPNASFWDKKTGNDFKIGGGAHAYYDASLVNRIELAGMVVDERKGEKKILGERYRLTIRKSKIAGKDAKTTVCHFHVSNGKCAPPGIDLARDLVELGERLRVIGDVNGRKSYGGKNWNVHDLVKELGNDPKSLKELDDQVRLAFAEQKPVEITEDGEVIE